MNITTNDLKELLSQVKSSNIDAGLIGQKVIIRTYSAGAWFGLLKEKEGNEIILSDARRLWRWWAAKSVSLSGVANYGVKPEKSKITPAVSYVWLEAIEIIPCTMDAISSIEACQDVEAY